MKPFVLRGWLTTTGNGEANDLLGIEDEWRKRCSILAEKLHDTFGYGRHCLSVRYFITDVPVDVDSLESELASMATGDATIKYGMRFSDYTGYLWTKEVCDIGGHDLIQELSSRKGKFLHLEIREGEQP